MKNKWLNCNSQSWQLLETASLESLPKVFKTSLTFVFCHVIDVLITMETVTLQSKTPTCVGDQDSCYNKSGFKHGPW